MARHHHAPWEPGPEDRAVAAAVGPDVAWLPLEDGSLVAVRHPRDPGEPRSAVSGLVRAVWALDPARAHGRLRARIRTTTLAPFDLDLVRVAARRVTVVAPVAGPCPPVRWLVVPPVPPSGLDPGPAPRALEGWVDWALAARGPPTDPSARATADRPVVAVLVGPDGRALGAARNRGGQDRTLHAETVLLWSHWAIAGGVPEGAVLVTTLQCCRMCAASWATCAPPDLRVRYAEADPGPFARSTLLARRGQEAPAGRAT